MSGVYVVHTLESLKARCEEEGACWIWKGATDGHGKPSMRHKGKVASPRRVVRELKDGKPLAPGVIVVPKCGNSLCVSPECSVKTDNKGKARMAAERGAYTNPAKNRRGAMTKRATSWITEEMVARVRAAASSRIAAQETGISPSHCKAIRRGEARVDFSANPWSGLFASNDSSKKAA